jgi:esterase
MARLEPPTPVALAHTDYGAGPLLLILHGLYGAGANWTAIARQLAARYRVSTLDLRNHGASPWAEAMDYRAMAADIAAFIAVAGAGKATLIGHSMGGKAAMTLALAEPALVEKLVVVDIAPVTRPQDVAAFAEAMRAVDLHGVTRRGEVDALLRPQIADDAVRHFLLQNLVAGDHGLRWRLNLDAILAGMDDIAGFPDFPPDIRYPGPALLVRGALSLYVRDSDLAVFSARFPACQFATVPGAGHWVHAERPQEFLATVEGFLAAG